MLLAYILFVAFNKFERCRQGGYRNFQRVEGGGDQIFLEGGNRKNRGVFKCVYFVLVRFLNCLSSVCVRNCVSKTKVTFEKVAQFNEKYC